MDGELTVQRLMAAPLAFRGVRVVTLKMVDQLHQRAEGTAGRNFRENRGRLREGEDYFEVPYDEWSQWVPATTNFVAPGLPVPRSAGGQASGPLIVLTESGYLMVVKSLTDDLAWDVQRALVNCYFRGKAAAAVDPLLAVIEASMAIRQDQLAQEKRLAAVEGAVEDAHRLAENAFKAAEGNHGYFSILGYLRRKGIQVTIGRASVLGRKLTAMCEGLGITIGKVADPRFGVVNTYPESVLDDFFREEGDEPHVIGTE